MHINDERADMMTPEALILKSLQSNLPTNNETKLMARIERLKKDPFVPIRLSFIQVYLKVAKPV
jgi:hypothetical protein